MSSRDLILILEAAIARIELANSEGNPILEAWLPSAKAAVEAPRDRMRELELEVERLRECAERTAKAKARTLSVEMPSERNGMRFYVTAPYTVDEEGIATSMAGVIAMLVAAMTGKEGVV